MSAPLLQLEAITKSFGAVRALQGISFDLRPGEVHALLGENGAGKSTLIKVITGAHEPDSGSMAVAGTVVRHFSPTGARQLGIACVYQQPALFPDLTVAENIALRLEPVRRLRRIRWGNRRAQAAHLLGRIGAAIAVDKEVRHLSMPEQQLVEIACALGASARIVIMDEPTASLTRQEQELLFGVVRDLRAAGTGIIYISHRLEEIFALADRVTVLRDGESVGTIKLGQANAAGARASVPPPVRAPGQPDSTVKETDLIRMMVGREMSHIYPPSEAKPGETVLALRSLGCQSSGVRGVTLEVRAGEVLGLAGLVGAGRTELARVLFGLTPADAGEIRVRGQTVRIRSPRDALACGIAYVPEDRRRHGVILTMPVAHNITMAIHRQLFPGTWLRLGAERALATQLITQLGVKTRGPEAPASSLSGGNQQKVSLARWLAARPQVLILDEPTQGVDVGAKSEIHKIIRQLAKGGVAVLLISSDLPEVLGMSDRIAVMRHGTLQAILPGTADAHEVMAEALGQSSSRDSARLAPGEAP